MITLYGFGRVYPEMLGHGRDLRAQWALEEVGLPYRFRALDFVAGELDSPTYSQVSIFRQVPVIDDDDVIVAESGAIVLYLAEKAGKLIPTDFIGRMEVVQWCFAALATVERPLSQIDGIDAGMGGVGAFERRAILVGEACRWFDGLERRLEGREWIASEMFTVADILLATALREVGKTDLLEPYPRLGAYYARALARPAWQRTRSLCAERNGVAVADIL
ncbi:glutathione S-transferase family protein [Mesorhizobium sp. B4-1-3]|uniref:glutathione S-transferase family protein n=1 Tax=Mesorhizobium sp. B4-1-3 TaxID=2589889 RepID=UPI00112D0C18|nr:glutathione S-transferase family protein [Mesorhizobium sp. B4-1-3]TPI12986.1 glutathione S-transferase family protein [Mesorhizobium sp. B4-1-3]